MSDQEQLTVIKFVADGSGVESGLTSIKRSIADLGTAVKSITDKTNAELAKVGTKELPVSDGLVRASKTIIKQTGDIEKAIATFGSTASSSLKAAYKDINSEEVRLRGLGIDAAIMNPYLEKLREVKNLTSAVAAQERTLAQEAAKSAELENKRLEHTLELKRQLASVKSAVESNATAKQAEIEAQQKFKLLALNNQIQASNKAVSDAQAAAAAKTLKDLKDLTAAQAAYRQEVVNSELNFTYTGRGKSTAFLADKGQRLGFDSSFIANELAGYKKIEDASKAAFQAANPHLAELAKRAADAGTSVKGLSASMRNVPAQFTDIIVSLQGGQAPLTVLLQQGGQLKDMFGGIGNATRALGGYVLSLINPFSLVAAGVGALALAYIKGAAEGEAYNKSIIMTGNYAGTTALRLSEMAQAISASNGSTISASAEALAALAGNGTIASAQFTKLGDAAVMMQKATGTAVADTVKQFAELGKDPLAASVKLNESTNYLTESVYKQIKALVDQGDTLQAGVVAQNAWADAIGQRAPALIENLGLIERAWRNVTDATKAAISAAAGIGRPVDATTAVKSQIEQLQDVIGGKGRQTAAQQWTPDAVLRDQLRMLQEKLVLLEKGSGYEALSAAYQGEAAKAVKARSEWDKVVTENLSKQQKMALAIADARGKFDLVQNKTPQDVENYAKQIAVIQERFKETEKAAKSAKKALVDPWDKSVITEYAQAMEKIFKVQLKAEESAEGLSKTQTALREVQSGPQWEKFSRQMQEQIIYSASLSQGAEDEKSAQKALQEVYAQNAKELEKYAESQQKSILAADDEVTKAQASYDARSKLASVIQEEALARLENARAQIIGTEDTSVLDAQIAAKRKLIDILTKGEVRDAGEKMAKDMAAEQKKAAEESRKYWEDALMRAFESGKGFFESLWSTIKNTLQTQVLKVLIAPVTGALSGVASAGSSDLISGAGSLASMGAQFGSAASITLSNGMISGFGSNMANIAGQLASGSYTSALGMSLPYLGAAVAAFSALKSLGAFGSNFISATDSGRARIDYTAAGIGGNSYNTTGDALQTAAAQKSVETLAQSYFKTAAQLGINAMQATFEFGSNSGREGAAPQTVLGVNIGKAAYSSGEIASGDAAGLQLAASRAIITALKASEMPAYLSKVFDDLTVSTATQDQISSALQYAGSLKSIRDALLETREPLQIVKDNVASAFAALGTSAETFKADFVAAIDAGITTDALSAWQALGVSLDQVTASAKATAEWQNKIDIATGKTTQREIEKAAALANADTATAKLIKEFYALEDAAKAAEDVKTMNAAIADTSNVIRDFYTMLAEKATALKQTLQGWKDTYAPPDPAALAERIADGINNSGATENISATELLNMSVADLNAWAAKVSQLTVPETVTSGILNGDALRGAIANAVAGAYTANTAGFDASVATPGALAKLLSPSIAEALKAMGVDNATSTSSATTVSGMLESALASVSANWRAASGLDTVPEIAKDWVSKALGGINDIALTDTVLKPIFDTIQADVNALIGQIQAKENYVPVADSPSTLGIDKAASEKISLQNQLNALTDTAVQALKRQRDALDESNWALFDQVQAVQKANAVSDEQKSLQDQLNALTDSATQALTRQRDALDESNRALFDSVQLEKEKQRQVEVNNSKLSLQAQIYALTGDKVAALSVRDQQRVIELSKLDAALQPLQTTLWGLQDAAETTATALAQVTKTLDTAKSEANAAYDALSRAVSAQKSAVQETISNVSSIIDSIDSAVKSLRGDAAGAGTFASAQAFLDNALNNASATGYLPDREALANAISDLNKGLADQVYATEADATFQKLVIAGKLEALGKVAKPQLSAAEEQLGVLEATLDTAKAQLDALLGVDSGVMSVADAMMRMGTSLEKLAAAIDAEKATGSGDAGDYNNLAVATAAINAYEGGSAGVYRALVDKLGASTVEAMGLGDLQDLAWAAKRARIPGFKVGTNYVPNDGPYYLHEGEAVTPKAYNPAAGGQQNNNARMESLIEGLTKEVQRLQAIVNDGNKSSQRTADAVNGRPEQPMLVETV